MLICYNHQMFDTGNTDRIMEMVIVNLRKGRDAVSAPDNGQLHCCAAFQDVVDQYLVRHRSILDVVSKFQEASARTNRAIAKAVTVCGCVQVNAGKQALSDNITYAEMKEHMATHLEGALCEHCREVLESELGRTMFYISAICNLFDLNLRDVLNAERERVKLLGVYNLT